MTADIVTAIGALLRTEPVYTVRWLLIPKYRTLDAWKATYDEPTARPR